MAKTLRILLVEDSEDDLHLVVRKLTRSGYAPVYRQVYTETALRSALQEDRWDVVVCDYALPGFRAEDALKAVQEADPDTPFIVVSGRIGEETAVAMMRAGAHDYLMKDNLCRLVPAIERELREAEVRRRRRRAEEELRAANAAKDRFLATLSHELRNPLAAISASLDALRLRAAGDPAMERVLCVMRRNVEIQARLVNDLLDLCRISLGKVTMERRPIRLDTVLRSVVCEYQGVVERAGLSLTAQRLPPVWTDGDADRLRQVFGNLLDNAVKFTPPGGRITVTMEQQEGWIRVSVEDTGAGLAPEQLDSVFDLFRQGPGANGERRADDRGLGVGLALVKQLVEMHGGRVWAESAGPGRGSRFTVELAACPAPAE
ncbi:MAG TPA: hybrid sensor histidine kinase/response regulator, partial [Limnochordales bacterium]